MVVDAIEIGRDIEANEIPILFHVFCNRCLEAFVRLGGVGRLAALKAIATGSSFTVRRKFNPYFAA